jgi:hypothetical protein
MIRSNLNGFLLAFFLLTFSSKQKNEQKNEQTHLILTDFAHFGLLTLEMMILTSILNNMIYHSAPFKAGQCHRCSMTILILSI